MFAPEYTRNNLEHYMPVDAIDACHAKFPGQGTFYCRGTLDADRHTHPLMVAHLLTSESTWGWRHFFKHEKAAYDDAETSLDDPERFAVPAPIHVMYKSSS